ncbi:hypothetical protein [Mycobacterium sp. Marseille-P9652]|uniref:hypothetical protein n=1 Tax=Mycobacterium sp. Marseille-P9652 TaxID=2654950 RepID=UPI0012E73FA4|nr:hypothetical protein [Mycobacterium sp. Marseille-P9652]
MEERGHRRFAGELARFAARHADPGLTAVAERAAAPLRVAVRGRPGVGRATVARALARAGGPAGLAVQAAGPDSDVLLYVTAEVVKPEDADAIAAARPAVVAVLNKADLTGSLSGRTGEPPTVAARARCAKLSALLGEPVEPMIGPLAVAALDGLDRQTWAALRVLADHPSGAASLDGSFAGFLSADNPVPADVRVRLLDTLDLFGVALGMAAVRRGRTPAQLRALLRRVSGIDAVLGRVAAAGAEPGYRRVLDAVVELEALAAADRRLAGPICAFLSSDDAVLARMAAAAAMAEAAGLDPLAPAGHLSRALRWQRYGRASAGELRRACGADIVRGSLRLWTQTRRSLPGETPLPKETL